MTTLTPLNGYSIPEDTDGPPDVPTMLGVLGGQIDKHSTPTFATATARDTAFSASGSVSDGQVCTVGGKFMVYRAGGWRVYSEGNIMYGRATLPAQSSAGTAVTTVTFAVPFASVPTVVATVAPSSGVSQYAEILNSTTSGFQVRVSVAAAVGAAMVNWIAISAV